MNHTLETGSHIGPYIIEGILGRGSMGEVYRARSVRLDRHEALKVISPALAHDRGFLERFVREAQIAAKLNHPNIATVYGVSMPDAVPAYFAMELVSGGDLADLLADHGRLPLATATRLLAQIASALDYAHSRGVIHRDIKPANILLHLDMTVKVGDFGIARPAESMNGTRATQAGLIVGTPEYMSPEQAGSGETVDSRTDQYSLAVLAYEMLCGQPPFSAAGQSSSLSVVLHHVHTPPPPPVKFNPDLSPGTAAALLRGLAKHPADRFPSCSDFVTALSQPAESSPHGRRGDTVVASRPPEKRPAKSSPWPYVVTGAVVLAGLGLIGAGISSHSTEVTVDLPGPTSSAADGSGSESNEQAPSEVSGAPPATPSPPAPAADTPRVLGITEDEARNLAQARGLKLEVTTGQSTEFMAGVVASQYPSPDVPAAPNSVLRVRISTGPGPVTPTPAATPSPGDFAEVQSNFAAWQQAWNQRDTQTYLSMYSHKVLVSRGNTNSQVGFTAMSKRITAHWKTVSYVRVTSGEPSVWADGSTIRLSVHQDYEDSGYWDTGTKRLQWSREDSVWRIIRESFAKEQGGSK